MLRPKRLQLFGGNAALQNVTNGLVRPIQYGNHKEIVGREMMISNVLHRHTEKALPTGTIEDCRQFQTDLFDGEVRELRGFAGSVDGNAPVSRGSERLEHGT